MNNISDKIFLCYAWENTAEVKQIAIEWESELGVKLTSATDFIASNNFEANEETFRAIENADIVALFISGASKKTAYVKECVIRAQNTNKNILPITIDKGLFSSMPSEFRFRTKPYNYNDKEDRTRLLAQLKATLGINIENGDEFGALVHVVTDMDAYISRYGERLDTVFVGKDNKIRLRKGVHLLDFVAVKDYEIHCSVSYEVKNNDGEQFLSVSLAELYNKKLEEREFAAKQAAMRKEMRERELEQQRQAEEAELRRKQRLHEMELQRKRELDQQRDAELEQMRQRRLEEKRQRELEEQKKAEAEKEGSGMSGCTIFFLIILSIAMPWTLIFTIPYFIYKASKSND